jgi:protein ImuB
LTAALAGWLAARQAGLRECRLELRHRQGATEVPLCFADLTRDEERFQRLLRERLERLSLTAPVEALGLAATAVEDLPGASGGLFDDPAGRESMAALVERLRARLGEARVSALAVVDDHRPECATRPAPVGAATGIGRAGRPFWLLAVPEPLAEVAGRPSRGGPLRLLTGPERIESGWWDGGEGYGDLRRDYFVALTADDRWAWVFRELRAPGGWFLHGWFG